MGTRVVLESGVAEVHELFGEERAQEAGPLSLCAYAASGSAMQSRVAAGRCFNVCRISPPERANRTPQRPSTSAADRTMSHNGLSVRT